MRHTFGLILGILLAPALAYGSAWGYVQAGASYDALNQTITDRNRMYGSFALLAAVGLVVGIVVLARWASPLVSLVPALVFIAWTVYFLISPATAQELPTHVPHDDQLDTGLRILLGYGVFAVFGFALLVPAWAPRRWSAGSADGAANGARKYEKPRHQRSEFNLFD